jgi:hypothetical protein
VDTRTRVLNNGIDPSSTIASDFKSYRCRIYRARSLREIVRGYAFKAYKPSNSMNMAYLKKHLTDEICWSYLCVLKSYEAPRFTARSPREKVRTEWEACNHTAIFRNLARAPALFLDPSKPTLELENTHFIPHLIALGRSGFGPLPQISLQTSDRSF